MRFHYDCSQFIGPAFNKIRPKAGGAPTSFEYSAAGKRVRRLRSEQEIVYVDDSYEQETNGNTVTERVYVSNNERVVAIAERSNGTETWQFVHTDHLGSVDSITDAGGHEIERRSFNAWGAPRHPKWGNQAPIPLSDSTRRNFTWHESDDEVGLVNAKGRLYDPQIARFLQVDPIISEPLDAQTHNPYSYVRNRPLVFTDPSGFVDEAQSVLIYGGGTPAYVTPDHAQLVPDEQKTWLFRAPRETPSSAPPPPSTAEVAPASPDKVRPSGTTPGEQFVFGVGERAQEFGPELVLGLIGAVPADNHRAEVAAALIQGKPIPASPNGGDVIDHLNKINPLYTSAMDVVKADEAHEKGDFVQVGRSSLDIVATAVMVVAAKKAGGGKGASKTRIPDGATVCRGGTCTAERFANGSGVTLDASGRMQGASVNAGTSIGEASAGIPNGQLGVTTAGQIRAAGGDVISSPTPRNPNHATLSGITPLQAERLFTPTIINPSKGK